MSLRSDNLFVGTLVRLTAPTPEDTESFARWSNDAEYLRMLDSDVAMPRTASFFEKYGKNDSNTGFEFRIRTLADNKLIGFVALHGIEWNNQSAMLAIGIGEPEYRGKGYGSDTLQLVLNYAFRELNLYRVGLNVFSYNPKAIRAYERAGFILEGTIRGFLYRDGERFDELAMGILREEWLQKQKLAKVATSTNPGINEK